MHFASGRHGEMGWVISGKVFPSLPHSNPWFLRQAWFRNTWSWNHSKRPSMTYVADERRIEIVSHLSCLMYFDVVFALNNQRYLMCKIHFDP